MTADARQVAEEVPDQEAGTPPALVHAVTPWQERPRGEVIDEILRRLGEGETLTEICNPPAMPPLTTVKAWRSKDAELRVRFAHAREEWRDALQDQAVDIARAAKPGQVELAKLQVWTIMQLLGRADNQAKNSPAREKTLPPRIEIVGIEPRRLAAPVVAEPEPAPEPTNPDGLVL